MIHKIEENVVNNKLTVKVECNIKKYASHPIKLLTTEKIVDILKHKYKNLKLLQSPNNLVGNTTRRKIRNFGTWIFEIEQKEEKIEKPKPKTKTTRKTTTTQKPKQTQPKTSIRGRISKLASKED